MTLIRGTALTQPEVQVVLQVPRSLFDGVEDQIGVTGVESSVQVLGHGHQVKVLHPPHLETLFLPGPLKLWVMYCHAVCRRIVRQGLCETFAWENGTSLEMKL